MSFIRDPRPLVETGAEPMEEEAVTEVFDRSRDREEADEGLKEEKDRKRTKVINILESRFGLDDDPEDLDEIIKATDAWIEDPK